MKEGWEYKKLGEVTSTINGLWTGKKTPFINVAVVRNTNFTKDCKLDMTNVAYLDVEEKQFSTRKLQYGDIIIEKSGGSEKQPVGRPVLFNIKEGNYSFSNFTSTLRINNKSELDPHFLHYSLVGAYFRGATSKMQAKTTGIHNLDFKAYLRLLIPIPTIEEQQQIVSELDLLSGVIEKQKAQLEELDKLAQSIFYDMFGDPVTNEKGWNISPLENIVSDNCTISYGIVQPGEEVEDGIPVVRPVDMVNSIVYKKGLKVIDKSISDSYKRTLLEGGELLFCVRGTTGIMSFAADELKGCNVTRGITPLSFNNNTNKYYVYFFLSTSFMKAIIAERTRGIALKQINMKDVRLLPIYCPPLSLQQEFAAKVEAIEAMKAKVRQSLKEAETLFNSRMDYYFN